MPHILLLEDDETIAFGIERAMKKEGSTTVWCRTLKEAQSCLDEKTDLVLLDLNLPDGNGFSFCRQVKAFDETLPVIFLTVRDDERTGYGGG